MYPHAFFSAFHHIRMMFFVMQAMDGRSGKMHADT